MKSHKQILLMMLIAAIFISSCTNSAEKPRIGAARFSPDGQYLILSIQLGKDESIYRMRKDGTDLQRLTFAKGIDNFPAYSPDGLKIVFSSTESTKDDAPAGLYIMDSDGSNKRCLTFGEQSDTFPIFSPDGAVIYFVRSFWYGRHSNMVHPFWQKEDIYSINSEGTDLNAITEDRCYDISPISIFPDGKKILARIIISGEGSSLCIIPVHNPSQTRRMSVDLKELVPFGFKASEAPYDPQLSLDGKNLLFVWSWEFEYDLYLMNLTDNKIRKLTNLRSYILYPSFSYDGKEIVFLSDPGKNGNNQLWIANSDGTNPRRIDIDFHSIR